MCVCVCVCVCDCVGVNVIVWVGVGVIARVRKGVGKPGLLPQSMNMYVCVRGGGIACVCVSGWVDG